MKSCGANSTLKENFIKEVIEGGKIQQITV
jgi:hypothetical protein